MEQEEGDDGDSASDAGSNNYDVGESELIDDSELQVIHSRRSAACSQAPSPSEANLAPA